MSDEISRTIYKMEIDDSAYSAGVNRMTASTDQLAKSQQAYNDKNDELIEKLADIKDAQTELRQEASRTRKELKDNEEQIKRTTKALEGASGEIKDKLSKNLEVLTSNNIILKKNLQEVNQELVISQKGLAFYNKELNESIKANTEAKKAVNDLFNVKKTLGEEVKKLTGHVREMAVGFISGFAGGIVAQVVPVLIDLGKKLLGVSHELTELEKRQKLANEIQSKAIGGYIQQTTHLQLIKERLLDLSVPEKERMKLLVEYNSLADKNNKLDKTQIDNTEEINKKITAQISLIEKRGLARAAEAIIAQKAEKFLNAQLKVQDLLPTLKITPELLHTVEDRGFGALSKEDQAKVQQAFMGDIGNAIGGGEFLFKDFIDSKQEFDRALKVGSQFIDTDSLTSKGGQNEKDKKDKKIKEIENVYVQMLAELRSKLAAATERVVQSEPTIFEKFVTKLAADFGNIDQLVKNKKLTNQQGVVLKGLIDQINEIDLNKELTTFRKNSAAALQAIDDELSNVALQVASKNIQNIRDEFDRERADIDQTFASTQAAIEKAQKALIKKIDDDQEKGLISEGDAKRQKFLATTLFGNLLTEAGVTKTNQELDLAFKTFKKSLEEGNIIFENLNLKNDEKTAAAIKDEKKRFEAGEINYKQFQKNITDLLKSQKAERDRIRLLELKSDLDAYKKRLEQTNDPKQRKEIEKNIRQLRSQIASAESQTNGVDDTKKPDGKFMKYVEAYAALAQSIISFWQKANEAEAAALDRSISLQEKRVEAAQRIADRGNASYLKAEQDRLNQLNVQRENAARKQLAIDAALQASQLLVGITGAISKIASGIGAAETIAEIAIIIGALATGYGLVKNLQGNQPRLFKGTKYLSRGDNPSGRDTIPAMLNEGEAVIPTDKNKDYHPAIAAIYDGTIPADHMNNFVKTYHQIKRAPMPNYQKIGEAAQLQISADGKMAVLLVENNKKLEEQNQLQRATLRAMKNMSVSAKIDRDGVAIAVNEYMQQMEIDKKL